MGDHRWRGYAHPELYKMINSGPGVAASRPIEDKWKALSEALGEIDASIHEGLEKIGANWQGSTAAATQTALSPLAQWAADAQQGSNTMKTSAELQAEYIADARKQMPEPVPVTTEAPSTGDKILGALTGPVGMMHVIQQQKDHEAQEAAQDNAEQKAVAVMNTYQANSEWNSNTLGEFVPPPQVVIDTPPPGGAGSFNSSSAGYTSQPTWTPPSGGGTTSTSWAPSPTGPAVNPSGYTPPTGGGGGTTTPSWAPPTQGPAVNPPVLPTPQPGPVKPPVGPSVFPPSWTPPPPTGGGAKPPATGPRPGLPPTTRVPGGRPGVPGMGRPGVPGMPGGMPGGMSGGPGGMNRPGVPGMPGGVPGGVPGAPGGPGALGRGGAAGVGAFGPGAPGAGGPGGAAGGRGGAGVAGGVPGAHGEGEEDLEHKAADYLVETEDVFGDDRLVAPPVIGEVPPR